uniref:Retrovirus-related Pol polyprotein from transposon TNT 1-94 n=1 Tax=Tanacetum cinerariifolium TaxID=118510 RepID=A0A6L2MNL6_TANCI|nr:retrovirus-related Pol polyprotein from transposon TNT 1-94 [Tanacetum cinerariifolium]
MVAYLSKADASEGFNQIIDFLNESSLKYALTVNPNIYVSCIKQFWTTVAVKQVHGVTRLQALVDRKKVVVTEATIREALRLDDAEGVDCLPNEEIFSKLVRMGYEKPFTKLTFYKDFFSSQWKFLIHIILHCMSAKRTSWNEFSSSMASAIICLSSGDLSTHSTKYTSPALTHKVFANMRRVEKGFFEVETPLFEGMLVEQEIDKEGDADEHVEEVNTSDAAEGDDSAAHREVPTVAEEHSSPFPTPPTPPPQPPQDIPSTSQGRMIAEMEQNDVVVLKDDKEEDKEVSDAIKNVKQAKDETEPAKVQEVVDVVTTAKLITDLVTTASETVTAANVIITTTEAQVPAATTATLTAAPVRVAATLSRRRKGVVIRNPDEESNKSTIILAKTKSKDKDIDWDEAIEHVKLKAKEDPTLDYFKGMSYDDIRIIFEAKFNSNVAFLLKKKEQIEEDENIALQTINETLAEKAAKRRKLDEEIITFTTTQLILLVEMRVKDPSSKDLTHMILGHANMCLIQSLASKELARNLPKFKFDQHFCNACKIGKQAHASHKAKNIVSTTRCLELLHMDLFCPSAIRSYGGNCYTLVIVDDYSSKAYIIVKKHTRKVDESFNVIFDETPSASKTSPMVDDDLDEEEAIKFTKKKNLENYIEDETLEIDEIVNIKESRRLSQNNLQGTRTEFGFKRAFATLFGQDIETFTGTMFLNVEQPKKQLDKEDFQEIGSMNTKLAILEFHATLIQHMESVKKSIDERAQHKREYDSWMNERQMQSS